MSNVLIINYSESGIISAFAGAIVSSIKVDCRSVS